MKLNRTYLEGVIEAERVYNSVNKDLISLKKWIDIETQIVDNDPRWVDWTLGVKDCFEFIKGW